MTLTLTDKEILSYFEMTKDLNNTITELNSILIKLQSKLSIDSEMRLEVLESKEKTHTNKPVLANTKWSNIDIDLLKDRIFYQGKYTKEEVNINYVHNNLFPDRTLDGIKYKIYSLGGCIRNNQIKPKIIRSK